MTPTKRARRVRLGAEVALAFGVGVASFAVVGTTLAATDSVAVAVVLAPVCTAGVVAIMRVCGVAYGVAAAIAALVAYDWFVFPPTHPLEIPDSANLADLIMYLAVAVLVGELAAHAGRRAHLSEEARSELADEQAALRRVATLVARESPPAQVFAAVAAEVGRLLGVEDTKMYRYEGDGTATVVANWGELDVPLTVGARLTLEGDNAPGVVLRTGRPVRIDGYEEAKGSVAAVARSVGIRSAVGTPIVVDGRLWGAMIAGSTRSDSLPADTEARIGEFTELVATAISNIQARSDLAASRARIVAAADQERARVVRDLHDGAQQRLVHTVVTLKLARRELVEQPESAAELVSEALVQAEHAMTELRELAHGILPAVLTLGGLRAGVDALASRMPVPVANGVVADRLPAAVEATAYFVVAEALTNVAKHSQARGAEVVASVEEGVLRVEVCDDGIGGARPEGTGMLGLGDRLAALDGTLRVESPPGEGTRVVAAIPVRA